MLQRYYLHGSAGVIEYPDRTEWIRTRGWGLDFRLKAGQVNYVHYPLQIQLTNYVSQFNFWQNHALLYQIHPTITAQNGFVSAVHVYDGYKHLLTREVHYGPCDKEDFLIEFGGKEGIKIHTGLGITLKVVSVDDQSAQFSLHSIGYQARGPAET